MALLDDYQGMDSIVNALQQYQAMQQDPFTKNLPGDNLFASQAQPEQYPQTFGRGTQEGVGYANWMPPQGFAPQEMNNFNPTSPTLPTFPESFAGFGYGKFAPKEIAPPQSFGLGTVQNDLRSNLIQQLFSQLPGMNSGQRPQNMGQSQMQPQGQFGMGGMMQGGSGGFY